MPAGGYFGRALIADVGDGSGRVLPLPDDLLRAYLGGAGLGAWLMHRLAPPGVGPLAPEAPLAFVFAPLVGTPLALLRSDAFRAEVEELGGYRTAEMGERIR